MLMSEKQIFDQFSKLANNIKQNLKKKGLVVPVQRKDGSIQVGVFTIVKKTDGYYINDKFNESLLGPLNLAKTAVVLANDLALGRWPDHKLIESDQWYGYKDFEEKVATSIAEKAKKSKDADKLDFNLYQASVAASRKAKYKKTIDTRFDKLYRLV